MDNNILTVEQVTKYIKGMIESDQNLESVWIKGEISNFKNHSSGHMYLTLKDEKSVIKAVMFRGNTYSLRFMPENGIKVMAHGRVGLYERDGSYQLYIDKMEPDGIGSLYMAYEQLKRRLEQEGIFEQSHKKPLPLFPTKIAVVTSPTGAAVRDILNILKRRYPLCDVVVVPVLVQGDGAAESIASAIKFVNDHKIADVIIAGRGGGSIEDLWAFNEEICARAVYNSDIPVISAVGHETDFTICDFASDLRAPTPSAAAELAVMDIRDVRASILGMLYSIEKSAKHILNDDRKKIENYSSRLRIKNLTTNLDSKLQYIDSLLRRIEQRTLTVFSEKQKQYALLLTKLEALNPLSVMKRGYMLTMDENKKIIKSIKNLKVGQETTLAFKDGKAKTVIKEIDYEEYEF